MIIKIAVITTILAVSTYFVYPFLRYVQYLSNLRDVLDKDIFTEAELTINKNNHFCISCQFNNEFEEKLMIDTKATSLIKESTVNTLRGAYWGKLPFQMENAYNEKNEMKLYAFDQLKIGILEIKKPLFSKITKDNSVYTILEEGLIGVDFLSIGIWKFDLQKNIIRIFSNNNQEMLEQETSDFIKIENGLLDNGIALSIEGINEKKKFTLDLGFSGDIEINNDIKNALLRNNYSHQKIERLNLNTEQTDTIYIFENITVKLDTLKIENCQLSHISSVNENFIGSAFMRNFNFVLMYGHYIKHQSQKDLYLQMIDKEKSATSQTAISKFGLNIASKEDKVYIKGIEENGIAVINDLRLGEEVIEIRGFDLLIENLTDSFISYTNNIDSVYIRTPKRSIVLKTND